MKLLGSVWLVESVRRVLFYSKVISLFFHAGSDKLEKLPPQIAPHAEIQALKVKMARSLEEIRSKSSTLTVQDLKRLLFRCAATLISLEKVSEGIL